MRALLVLGALALLGCQTQPAPSSFKSNPQAESMQRMWLDVWTLRDYAKGGSTQADAEHAAAEMVLWSNRLGELFPADQKYADLTPDAVRGAPPVMTAAADEVLATVRGGDRQRVTQSLDRAERDGCGYCHRRVYR